MSKDKQVMSHDPLAGLDEEPAGEVVQVPAEALTAVEPEVAEPVVGGVLKLEESITIADVGEYQAKLAAYLVSGDSVEIDGSQVASVDGAGLQLLAAFVKDLISKSAGVTWLGASDALQRAARQFGVYSALQLDQIQNAA